MSKIDPDSIGKLKIIRVKRKSKKEKLITRLALGIALFIILSFLLSTKYLVTRVVFIPNNQKSPPANLYANLNDLNQWQYWAPWIIDDPSVIISLGEIRSGVGASQSWVGKNGKGSMTITKSSPDRGIDFNLSLNDGLYQSKTYIHFQKNRGKTYVTWTENGKVSLPVIGGYLALLMEPIAGSMLEQGLAGLQYVVTK